MKKILPTLLLLASIGSTNPAIGQVFVLPNKAGGEITLTMRPCVIKNVTQPETLREAYTWSPSTPYQEGCWTIVDGMVHVLFFSTGDRRIYPIDEFRKR